jgi:hypothetical protein
VGFIVFSLLSGYPPRDSLSLSVCLHGTAVVLSIGFPGVKSV